MTMTTLKSIAFIFTITLLKSGSNAFIPIVSQKKTTKTFSKASSLSLSMKSSCRRQIIKDAFAAGTFATIFGIVSQPKSVHAAIDACPPKSKNCIVVTWKPPSSQSKSDIISTLREVINAYPREGQNDIDAGGWTIVEDGLESAKMMHIEYKSSGTGFFAKAFNGGKPFVDDLFLELSNANNGDIEVVVRSNSRVGESDFGVNGKRVSYLAAALKNKNWLVDTNVKTG